MKPNLLLIWTDEQRADTIGGLGNPHMRTPHLDRLASGGVAFENAYCVQPVCTPSRATILTGLWPHTHGCIANNRPLPAETRTISEMAGEAYHRAYYGKWHLGDEIVAQHGFSEWVSIEDGMYRPHYSKPEYLERRSDYHHFLVENGFVPDSTAKDAARVFSRSFTAVMAEPFTKAAFLGERAAEFLHAQNPEQPFLLSVNFLEPHMPFFGPLNAAYDPETLPVGPAFLRKPGRRDSLRNRLIAENYEAFGFEGRALETEADWRRLRANYCGLVSMVDHAVGRILDALESSGQAENTIVVFTSDHGDMMGDHALLAKTVMYEESVRVPLIIRAPGIEGGRTIPARVSQIDLAPTLLDLMEQPVPGHLQGTSRRAVLQGDASLEGNDVFIEWNAQEGRQAHAGPAGAFDEADANSVGAQNWRSIVSHEGWKLNLCPTDQCELFDLNSDPNELDNRFSDPACQSVISDLTGRIRRWQRETGDPLTPETVAREAQD